MFQILNLTAILILGRSIVYIYKVGGKSICWVFQYNDCGENLWKFLGTFLLVPNFQNIIGSVPMTQGLDPYFILGSFFNFF